MSTPYLAIAHIAQSQNQPEVTANGAFDDLDDAMNAEPAFALTDASTAITLTQVQMASGFILKLTGTLTAARNVIVPAINRFFAVYNNSTGGFGVTVKTSGGTGILVNNGIYALLYCDGTNVVLLTAGGGSGAVINFSDNESASGSRNGVNVTFTLAHTPSPSASLILVLPTPTGNVPLVQGTDYTLSSATITMTNPPGASDGPPTAWYRY